jgi:hypothetical protein
MSDLFTWVDGMSPFKRAILGTGFVLESAGIILILFPDVLPALKRAGSWLLRWAQTAQSGIRRVLRIRPDTRVARMAVSEGKDTVRGRGVATLGEAASLEEKVRFLLAKHLEIDSAIDTLRNHFAESEKAIWNRFEQARQEVEVWTKGRSAPSWHAGGRFASSPRFS